MATHNFDSMSLEDLLTFAQFESNTTRTAASNLVGDRRPGYLAIARNIGHYARNKAGAMQCRERGDILAATNYETICERIYQELPKDVRW
jgi:hypothetical protein